MENIFIKKIKERLEVEPDLLDQLPEDIKEAIQADDIVETPSVSIPQILTSRQLRLSLLNKEIDLNQINTVLETLPEPLRTEAKINWEYAGSFERQNSLLLQVAQIFG